MKKNLLSLCCCLLFCCGVVNTAFGVLLQDKLTQAKIGDFIVTSQEGNYSLLFIRAMDQDTLILEEISIPAHQINLKTIDWKQWVQDKAPGHTSWTLSEIQVHSGKLVECFSFSKNGWLYLDRSEQFLTQFITLPLITVPLQERKKIGTQPISGEEDRRSPWNPPLVLNGKKVVKPSFEVLKTQWPDDGSRLALCSVELYFSKQDPLFPFPYWLEVQSPHYAFKIRAIDSGHGMVSSKIGAMPHRKPQILGLIQKGSQSWKLSIQIPSYFHKLHLFALDRSKESKKMIPIPCSSSTGKKPEELFLEISCSDLNISLEKGRCYHWVIVPENSPISVESEEAFTWK